MRVHVLQGRDHLYDFTREPSNLPADKGPWRPFKSLEIYEAHPALRISVNEADVLAGIKSHGYYLTDLTAQVPENELFEIGCKLESSQPAMAAHNRLVGGPSPLSPTHSLAPTEISPIGAK